MSLIDLTQETLGPNGVQDIALQLDEDPETVERAIHAALPMMLSGMAHTAEQPGGETQVRAAMGALDGGAQGIGGFGGALGAGGLGGILGSILGQHHSTVQDGVQETSGLGAGKAGKLLILLAPFILRALAKRHAEAPAQADGNGGLGGSLQQEATNAAATASPQLGGILGKILAGLS